MAELYASFEDMACVYLVMEYCEGGDLFKTMLMHGGSLEEQWVCVEVRGSAPAAQRVAAQAGTRVAAGPCQGGTPAGTSD